MSRSASVMCAGRNSAQPPTADAGEEVGADWPTLATRRSRRNGWSTLACGGRPRPAGRSSTTSTRSRRGSTCSTCARSAPRPAAVVDSSPARPGEATPKRSRSKLLGVGLNPGPTRPLGRGGLGRSESVGVGVAAHNRPHRRLPAVDHPRRRRLRTAPQAWRRRTARTRRAGRPRPPRRWAPPRRVGHHGRQRTEADRGTHPLGDAPPTRSRRCPMTVPLRRGRDGEPIEQEPTSWHEQCHDGWLPLLPGDEDGRPDPALLPATPPAGTHAKGEPHQPAVGSR